ncbi:MAG: asparagine synthase (glutamine-hydrolyzing) [bacterium]
MCGIGGAWAYHPKAEPIDQDDLIRVREAMYRRGPDGKGQWFSGDQRVGLVHRRLAIIDLDERAAQPMHWESRYTISFNGEIYNYRQLRQQLISLGAQFQTESDTEVILAAYAYWGNECFRKLRGMFALALWDKQEKKLTLARDPYGIKPLYYQNDGQSIHFASQVKALQNSNKVSKTVCVAAQVGFYLLGSVPEPLTWYESIKAVPAGTILQYTEDGLERTQQYFNLATIYQQAEQQVHCLSQFECQNLFTQELHKSIELHLESDVPVGIFLSSGVDSTTLLAHMHELGIKQIKSTTLGFSEFENTIRDEVPWAEKIAQHYNTQQQTKKIDRYQFEQNGDDFMQAMDQPSIDGLNAWFISKAANEQGMKVALSGLGGDELVGGYPSFKNIPNWMAKTKNLSKIQGLGKTSRKLMTYIQPILGSLSPKVAGMLEYGSELSGAYLLQRGLFMPWELDQVLKQDQIEEGIKKLSLTNQIKQSSLPISENAQQNIAVLESTWYMKNQLLRDLDWAGMNHSLEVRVPLVDSELTKATAKIGMLRNKLDGKKMMLNSVIKHPLAEQQREKSGFDTPVWDWQKQSKDWQSWKTNKNLTKKNTPWARRYAWMVAKKYSN